MVERRMGPALRERISPEDILQESFLHAWRDRARHEWRGPREFRNWLLSIVDHRIADAGDRIGALKRGGGRNTIPIVSRDGSDAGKGVSDLPASTTPSRIAWYREQASAIRSAVESLDQEHREVVMLRLVDRLSVAEVADRLGLGPAAVRHRLRRGAEAFRYRLTSLLGTIGGQSGRNSPDSAPNPATDSSP
jgi:RNA polymerase sigma-70 factor (ECF subfamily)